MSDGWDVVAEYADVVATMVEREKLLIIEERRRIAAEIEAAAQAYVERWTPIVGEDRAKAGALDILSIARKLTDSSKGA